MSYGAWISQREVRRSTGPGGGHGNPKDGYEILHTNIDQALDSLKLTHDDFDYSQSVPQYKSYFGWMRAHLAQTHPIVWMIMCAGDSHTGGGIGGIANYDHIEPVWGIYSNHSFDHSFDPNHHNSSDDHNSFGDYFPDDVIVHGADYGAKGTTEGPYLYRSFASLPDDKHMEGNCAKAIPQYGSNEFYPCVPSDGPDWGFAITGVVEQMTSKTLPLFLAVDRFDEPDMNNPFEKPAKLTGTVTVTGLTGGGAYSILRWDNYTKVPTSTEYLDSSYDYKHDFVAPTNSDSYQFHDPVPILSDGASYYRCINSPHP